MAPLVGSALVRVNNPLMYDRVCGEFVECELIVKSEA